MTPLSRRAWLGLAGAACAAQPEPVRLIAHRGGVVDAARPENSRAALEAAIAEGYWMAEVDLWRTRDGRPVLHHDATLQRHFRDPRRVEELDWDEFRALRAAPGGHAPIDFEEACALAAGRIRLMLDVKGGAHPDAFYARIEDSLARHGLLRSAYTLGGDRMKPRFWGKLWMSANRAGLRAAIARGEPVHEHYFLFELGSVLDEEALALCRQARVVPVAAINTFRYEMAKTDHWKGAQADIERLLALGVRHFQIDSVYARLFPR
jgi:hypothetical protein